MNGNNFDNAKIYQSYLRQLAAEEFYTLVEEGNDLDSTIRTI